MRIAPISKAAASHNPLAERVALTLFFSVFLFVGLGMAYYYVTGIGNYLKARDWRGTTCEILTISVAETRGSDRAYFVKATYRYDAAGHSYTGNRFRLTEVTSGDRDSRAAIVDALPPGSKVDCWFDPARPHVAVIDRETGLDQIMMGLLPLVFVAVGAGGLVFALFGRGRNGPVYRLTHSSLAKRISRRIPIQLKPTQGRQVKVAKLAGVTLAWAGFTWYWIRTGRVGVSDTFDLIALGGMGFTLVGSTIREILALYNPRVVLAVDSPSVALGDELQIDWGLDGKVSRLERLSIVLEGREEVTYGKGRNQETEASRFATIPVMTEAAPDIASAGSTRITIPSDTMHSFDANANNVIWILHVRGNVPNWADIDDEFPLTILPAR